MNPGGGGEVPEIKGQDSGWMGVLKDQNGVFIGLRGA